MRAGVSRRRTGWAGNVAQMLEIRKMYIVVRKSIGKRRVEGL
jgi:hypothetical protein